MITALGVCMRRINISFKIRKKQLSQRHHTSHTCPDKYGYQQVCYVPHSLLRSAEGHCDTCWLTLLAKLSQLCGILLLAQGWADIGQAAARQLGSSCTQTRFYQHVMHYYWQSTCQHM